jgi:betaine-aldehyde dehydrogenase
MKLKPTRRLKKTSLESPLPKHGYWINHTWVRPGNYRTLVNPATAEPLALVGEATVAETLHAIDAARDAFDRGPWRDSTAQLRGRVLFAMAEVVRRHKAELARLETLNMGKPFAESEFDMDDTATCFEYYGGLATKVAGEVNPVPDDALNFTLREPVGVCGLIIPWNYPLMMLAWKVAPALAAGCTMVLKPAEQTPLTALAFAGWLKKEVPDLPPGVLNIITGDGETCGATLVRSPKVDKIAFTGGTETGQAILRLMGETGVKKISLELGGKSPNVFFADADLKASIDGALFGVMINQGEVCSAGSRILVERKWHDRFLEHLVRQASRIPLGDPFNPAHKMGPLVTEEHRERVKGYVDRARDAGLRVATGGKVPKQLPGWYYPPTVLADVPPDAEIFQQEVFGPVVTVTPFEDEAEALSLANRTPFGLAGAIWTRDIFRAFRMVRKMRAGIVWVNTMQPCFVEAPWGGYKASGIGRELGRHGIEAFLESKQVHVNLSEKPIGWYD